MPRLVALISVLLVVLLGPAGAAKAQPVRERLESLANGQQFRAVFDGARAGVPAAVEAPARPPEGPPLVPPIGGLKELREAKSLLDEGNLRVNPFVFHPAGGPEASAPSSGLEGFVYRERELSRQKGAGALAHHVDDAAGYLDALLASVSWTEEGRKRIRELRSAPGTPLERYGRLMGFVAEYTEALRSAVAAADQAAWVREARIYEIFPRAYNLEGKRAASGLKTGKKFFADFGDRDLAAIKAMGFDTLWIMGVFPIGEKGRTGTGGGSPYSIKDFETVNPDLGTPQEFRALVNRAHRQGLKVILDFVANHTSLDSKLLDENPSFFVHRPAGEGRPPDGTFEHTDPATGQPLWVNHGGYESYGSVSFWIDTAQIDYSNVRTRRRLIGILETWVRDYGVDGFRVDMAYQVLNRYFSRNWRRAMPRREFLDEMTTEIKGKHPGTAFIAEAYDGWDELSRCGFDLIYSKNEIGRLGGHTGWYDAMASRNPAWIRGAIRREAYLTWQRGGSESLPFVGNHDEPSPRRVLGPWMEGASFLTLLKPGSLLFYGSAEIGYDAAVPQEHKPLPFSAPSKIDWSKPDAEIKRFHDETFKLAQELRAALGPAELRPFSSDGEPAWVGYLLVPERPGRLKAAAVLANPTDREVQVEFTEPDLGVQHRATLPPFGYRLVRF